MCLSEPANVPSRSMKMRMGLRRIKYSTILPYTEDLPPSGKKNNDGSAEERPHDAEKCDSRFDLRNCGYHRRRRCSGARNAERPSDDILYVCYGTD